MKRKCYVIIEVSSETAADAVKNMIEHEFDFLAGQVRVTADPEMTTLDRIIFGEKL